MEEFDILNHYGEDRSSYFHSVAPPLIQTSNFCYVTTADMEHALANEFDVPVYSRGLNPTVDILRRKLAALERAEDALVFSSGTAAMSGVLLSLLKQGDHVISVKQPYSWTNHMMKEVLPSFGISVDMVEGEETENFRRAMRNETRLIYLESPNSMTFGMQDIEAIAAMAHERDIITVIDNSYSTPIYQQPITLGADLVIHSASKYLSGHSDMVAGVVCGSEERIRHIFMKAFMAYGGILPPFESWLMIRGLRTLPLRLDRSRDTALKLISFLEKNPAVEGILYPFHPSNPQFELAKKQMTSACGLFSVLLKTHDREQIAKFADKLRVFSRAVSWGGFESLVFPAIALKPGSGIPLNLVRIYTGLEEPELLIRDMEQALGDIHT
ncbi:MAG: aminotransferase class I/II-fold pyridoxal phosphate-dependent enzyme [Bacteroidetes bacterium]|nr:aminotransferase class I/II-fold pyridoxal phosphate-dependent enzyme [Bacteroidota bacterium]